MNYKEGAIKSIKIHNFQTYSDIKLNFHPKLNLIIGPNGSGKSTIANAIAFVLGGAPKIIGKSKDIKEFVKFNTTNGYVEITLYSKDGDITIKRNLNSYTNSSVWTINGKITNLSAVRNVLNKLKINISSLCNFLPQERVSDFSKSTAEELLVNIFEIQENEELMMMRGKIQKLESEMEEYENHNKKLNENKKTIESDVQKMSKDVEMIREREERIKKIKLIEIKKEWLVYEVISSEYQENNQKIREKSIEIEKEKEKLQKLEDEIIILNSDSTFNEILNLNKEIEKSNSELLKKIENIQNLEQNIEKINVEKKFLEKRKEKKKEKIDNLRYKIRMDIEKLESFKIPESPELKYDLTEKNKKEEKLYDLKRKVNEIQKESEILRREMEELNLARNRHYDESSRRLEMLKKYHYDTYKAVMWLRENQDMFKEEIIEPCFLTLNIKNPNFLEEIEGFLNFQLLSSFICQNPEDFEKFMKICKEKQKLGINAVEKIKSSPKIPVSREEILKLGFDGYLIDFIDGRKEIIDYLGILGHFAMIPVSKKSLDEHYIFKNTNFRRIALNKKYYEIKKSRYSDDSVTIQNNLPKLNIFNNTLSQQQIEKINSELKEKDSIRKKNQTKYKNFLEEIEILKSELEVIYSLKSEYSRKINEINKLKQDKKMLTEIISENEKFLEKLKMDLNDELEMKKLNENEEKMRNQILCLFNDLNLIFKETNFYENFIKKKELENKIKIKNDEIMKKNTEKMNIRNDLSQMECFLNELMRKKSEYRDRISLIKEKLRKNKCKEYLKELEKLSDDVNELEEMLANEKARLTFLGVDEKVVHDLKQKENQLNQLNLSQNTIEMKKQVVNQKLESLKREIIDKIKIFLDPICSRFEQFFKKIGFDGKLEFVYENLKILDWKLNILVKFRKSENYEQLSCFRQSGGERSLTTIIFLLSLLETVSPFRVVDEINQGMDKFNEKKVHDLLVWLSENENSPQFFIITPKIVPNLTYNNTMKVIVLYPGVPENIQNSFTDYKNNYLKI